MIKKDGRLIFHIGYDCMRTVSDSMIVRIVLVELLFNSCNEDIMFITRIVVPERM